MFWRYQDLEDNYEMALDDMNFKAELWKSSSNVMTEWMDREEYKKATHRVDSLWLEKQKLREQIYSKVFIYFPKTQKLFREYTNLEVEFYLRKKENPELQRLDFLKGKENEIQENLLKEIKSHKSFFI